MFFERFMFYNISPGPVTTLLTLVYPFGGYVWLWLGVTFVFALVAIYLINLKSPLSNFNVLQIVLCPILSEPLTSIVDKSRKNWYGLLVLAIWPITGLLLSTAYSSNLLANLTVVEREKADNTFEVNIFCYMSFYYKARSKIAT